MILLTNQNNFADMTKEHAQVIKALRTTGCTWGRIAEIMQIVSAPEDESWGQVDGKELCVRAANLRGEDYMNEEWN